MIMVIKNFIQLIILLAVANNVHAATAPNSSTPIKTPYRIFIYNEVFAKRFGLDVKKAEKLDPGLLAIVGVIETEKLINSDTHKPLGAYACSVDMFIDSSLNIWYPAADFFDQDAYVKMEGSIRDLLKKMPDADLNKMSEGGATEYRSLLTTKKRDIEISMEYQTYKKEIFPGISYFSIWVPCTALVQSQTWELWLEKNGGLDYRNYPGNKTVSKNNFYQFSIPIKITGSEVIKAAASENDKFSPFDF